MSRNYTVGDALGGFAVAIVGGILMVFAAMVFGVPRHPTSIAPTALPAAAWETIGVGDDVQQLCTQRLRVKDGWIYRITAVGYDYSHGSITFVPDSKTLTAEATR